MVEVDNVEQVTIAVGGELRIKGEPQQTVIAPIANLFTDIKQRGSLPNAIFDDPDAACAFPHVHAARARKCQPGGLIPAADDELIGEVRGERGCRRQRCAAHNESRPEFGAQHGTPPFG